MKTQGKAPTAEKAIKAPALKGGDRIGLICPASRPESPAVVQHCVRIVEDMGFVPILGKHVMKMHGYMAGTDAERLEDLLSFWQDDSIAGIFCITGGFGSMHLLPYLNYDLMAAKPKVIVGQDENTCLLNAITSRTGLVTFHGPNLDQVNSKYTFERFVNAVSKTSVIKSVSASDVARDTITLGYPFVPVEGLVDGITCGGNLTAFTSLMGTAFQPELAGRILFFEDKNESISTLDRWLTTLYVSGQLDKTAGVAFGYFTNCGVKDNFPTLSLEELFADRFLPMNKPCCFGLPIGQAKDAATIPLGLSARFDSKAGLLEFLQPAVS
jgi:muramoyltetrapeptide carboxypeptidase